MFCLVHDLQCQQRAKLFQSFLKTRYFCVLKSSCWETDYFQPGFPNTAHCLVMHCWLRSNFSSLPSCMPYLLYLHCVRRKAHSAKVKRLGEKCKSKSGVCDSFALCVCAGVLNINRWEGCHAFHPPHPTRSATLTTPLSFISVS